jgi:hypothetical protein
MWKVQEIIDTKPIQTIVTFNHNSLVLAEKVFGRLVNNWRNKYKKYNIIIGLYENDIILKERKLSKNEN